MEIKKNTTKHERVNEIIEKYEETHEELTKLSRDLLDELSKGARTFGELKDNIYTFQDSLINNNEVTAVALKTMVLNSRSGPDKWKYHVLFSIIWELYEEMVKWKSLG